MPNVWRECTLGELLSLEYGKALPERDRDGKRFPVFGSSGIVGLHSQPLVAGPGIIVGRKGTAGSVLWSEDSFFPIDTTYWVKLRDASTTDLRFTALMLESVNLPGVCAQTGVPGLNRDRAYDIQVRLPSLPEQRRIVDLVGALDALVAAVSEESSALRELGLAWSQRHFHEGNGHAEHRLGDLLDEVIDHRGKTPGKLGSDFQDEGVRVISAMNIKEGRVTDAPRRCIDVDTYRRWMKVPTRRGDVLLTSEAPLGEVAQVATDEPLALGQRLFGLRADQRRLLDGYLAHFLRSEVGQHALNARASGSTVKGIRQAELIQIRLTLPDVDEQAAVVADLDALDSARTLLHLEEAGLREVRSALLANVTSGLIGIPASYDALLPEAI